MVRVLSIDRCLGVGSTHPYLAKLEENGLVFNGFIKLKHNTEGPLCLINELISYRLATALGVLMPRSGVAIINQETVDNTAENLLSNENIGSCFFSQQIEQAYILNERIMPYIDNKDMYEKIIVFDHLIYNTDRNPGNVILSGKKREKVLYAIDHTHVFKNQAIWDAQCLEDGINENDYGFADIIESSRAYCLFAQDREITASSLKKVAKEFVRICNEKRLDGIMDDLPHDWPIDNRNLVALKKYLLYRVEHLIEMCDVIVKNRGWRNE